MKRSTRRLPTDYVPARPLWHFGWRGYCLLPILLALLWVAWSGYDLRYQVQRVIMEVFGSEAMFEFTARFLTPHASDFSFCTDGAFGRVAPWTRFGLLPATCIAVGLAIHPRRRGLASFFVVFSLGLLVPILMWSVGIRLAAWLGAPTSTFGPSTLANVERLGLVGTVLAAIVLVPIVRSRAISAFIFAWLALGLYLFAETWRTSSAGVTPRPNLLWPINGENPSVQVLLWSWHAAMLVTMLTWSIRARLHHLPPHACQHCAYDLRGLPSSATLCPECGQPTPNARIHAHDEPAGASRGAGSSLVFAPTPSTNPNEKTGEPQGPPVQSSIITQTARENASRP